MTSIQEGDELEVNKLERLKQLKRDRFDDETSMKMSREGSQVTGWDNN